MGDGDTYTHGHHESVLRSHTWRTVENSAAYLIEALQPGLSLLDVGCGPGTITVDFGSRLAPGAVVGFDYADEVVAVARSQEPNLSNVTFAQADVYGLEYDDDAFDIVHAHQVLQHLTDPIAALREMRRVVKPGGIVAARDSDYSLFGWAPNDARFVRWLEIYRAVARHNRAEPDAGRYLLQWAHQAGFRDVTYTTSTWSFATDETRAWWGGLWADRLTHSALAQQAVDYGIASPNELNSCAAAFREWSSNADGTFITVHGEIVARG
jgi:ubiquinone/menaquinone biosynthesis C-methylase UbiE